RCPWRHPFLAADRARKRSRATGNERHTGRFAARVASGVGRHGRPQPPHARTGRPTRTAGQLRTYVKTDLPPRPTYARSTEAFRLRQSPSPAGPVVDLAGGLVTW